MISSPEEQRALQRVADLEPPLSALEQGLAALAGAMCRNDARAIEDEASALHRSLANAIAHFTRAARDGGVPPQLRHRLALASSQVAAQREALARATAALDRAIEVLLPEHPAHDVYSASGSTERASRSGTIQA